MSAAPIESLVKVCKRCGLERNAVDFYRAKTNRDGLDTTCRPCRRAEARDRNARKRTEVGEAEWRRRQREAVQRSRTTDEGRKRARLHSRVRNEAIKRLIELHRDDFESLMAIERRKAEDGDA